MISVHERRVPGSVNGVVTQRLEISCSDGHNYAYKSSYTTIANYSVRT